MEHKYDVISHLQHTFSNAIFLLHFLDPLWMANILFDLNMYARFSSISKLVNWVISDPMVHKHCVKSVQIRSFFLVHIFPYSVRMRENTDQEKLRIWTFFTQWKVWKTENLLTASLWLFLFNVFLKITVHDYSTLTNSCITFGFV